MGVDFCSKCSKTPSPATRSGERVYLCWTTGCSNYGKVIGGAGNYAASPVQTTIAVSER
ncbi:MAG: hypothetical protein Q8Q36_01980 [bacterium]|nr:hypothetical protein [bacterium]